jgi:hypothetical protein
MKAVIRLTLLGVLSILSACEEGEGYPKPVQEAAVSDTRCKNCNWATFLGETHKVQRLECMNDGKPEHCHLTVEDGKPVREVTVTFNQEFGSYDWELRSPEPGQEKYRMICPNLAPDPDNKRIISGTCIIPESDQGPSVHFFRATIAPLETDPTMPTVYFEFGHRPFDSCKSRPAHDGGGHLGH